MMHVMLHKRDSVLFSGKDTAFVPPPCNSFSSVYEERQAILIDNYSGIQNGSLASHCNVFHAYGLSGPFHAQQLSFFKLPLPASMHPERKVCFLSAFYFS